MTHNPSVQTGNEVTESVTLGTFSTPEHDLFCPCITNPATVRSPNGGTKIIVGNYCQCDLIQEVRADERENKRGDYIAKIRKDEREQIAKTFRSHLNNDELMYKEFEGHWFTAPYVRVATAINIIRGNYEEE